MYRIATEQEWLQATYPQPMLDYLRRGRASQRKSRLFAVAYCRRLWMDMSPFERETVEVAELFADDKADEQLLAATRRRVNSSENERLTDGYRYHLYHVVEAAVCSDSHLHGMVQRASHSLVIASSRSEAAMHDADGIKAWKAIEAEQARQTATLRCLFGNPFRPVIFSPAILAWNDGLVVRLAQAAYEERFLPAGTLDNCQLAVLANALEEAGCTDADMLGHLRGSVPHVRGCWAVDLILGKE